MTNDNQHDSKMDRRLFLRLLSGSALVLAAGGALAGCGGGGGDNNTTPPVPTLPANTQTVNGTVDLTQIGGSGLQVLSPYHAANAVDALGAYTTYASNKGAQLLFVTDGAGKVRALSVTTPASTEPLPIDAASTAIALILLSPGIATSEPTESSTHISQIRNLSSFAALASFLTTSLLTNDLGGLQANSTFTARLTAAVNEWASVHVSEVLHPHIDAADGSFSADFSNLTNITNAQVRFKNSGWRVLFVARQLLGANGLPLAGTPTYPGSQDGFLPGIKPTSWGSIFNVPIGTATTDYDSNIDLTNPTAQSGLSYTAYGPGFGATTTTFPDSSLHAADEQAAWGRTFLSYLAFPMLDLVTGHLDFLGKLSTTSTIWANIASSVGISTILTSPASTGDRGLALASTMSAIFTALAGSSTSLSTLSLPSTVIALPTVLTALSAVVSTSNGNIALKTWTHYNEIESVAFPISGGTVTVQ